MIAKKIEELAEETERKRREQNLVIHGKKEMTATADKKNHQQANSRLADRCH